MTVLAGSIPFRNGTIESNIEVVRRVPGAPKNIEKAAIEIEMAGKRLRVLDPVSLLVSKLELVAKVPQEGRHDTRHLRILVPCVRQFLGELLGEVDCGEIPSRHWLNVVGYLLKLTTTRRAIRIGMNLGLLWGDALPWDAMERSQEARIKRFLASQRSGIPPGIP